MGSDDKPGQRSDALMADSGLLGLVRARARCTLEGVFERLADRVIRHRWTVVGICLAVTLVAAFLGRGLFGRLGNAVSFDPSAESSRGAALAEQELGEGDPDVVALYRLPDGFALARGVADPSFREPLTRTLDRLVQDPAVARVVSELDRSGDRFVSRDRRSTFVVVSLHGKPAEQAAALPRIRALLAVHPSDGQTLRPQLGGSIPAGRALTSLAEQSLSRGERVALPVTGILLVILFGSLVAASLPLLMGVVSIVLALAILDVLSHVMTVDAFAVNVVTILGLGVAVDYALFLVSRYREEVARSGRSDARARNQALRRAVRTAGRSVLFSGVTVAASLAGLFVFRQPFLRSVAAGGLAVTLVAAALALVFLPAVIAILGNRLERGRVPRLWRHPAQGDGSFWQRLARLVIRRRVVVCLGVTGFLLLLALPFRRMLPSRADVRALPTQNEAREASEHVMHDFPAVSLSPHSLVVAMDDDFVKGDRLGELYDYLQRVAGVPGITRVDGLLSYANIHSRDDAEELAPQLERYIRITPPPPRGRPGLSAILHGRYTLVRAISTAPIDSKEAQAQVRALRALAPPRGGHVLVYGQAAGLSDFTHGLASRSPWMLAAVLTAMFGVLFVAFRSAILPLKAMLMTVVSLTASFGASVFIFQDGRFRRLLDYTPLGTTDATLPVLMFAVVFGLSMDYEVLILTRIRESYLRTGDNDAAIVEGLTQTGRLVTGAAAIMVMVFSAFAAAPVVFVKALGLGMALAIALDATVVRMLLVPSTMALLGRLNWWVPRRRRPPATSLPAQA
jgi:uncharacterized membrane protein YdfJ with MMPL/SSD domain